MLTCMLMFLSHIATAIAITIYQNQYINIIAGIVITVIDDNIITSIGKTYSGCQIEIFIAAERSMGGSLTSGLPLQMIDDV